MTGRWTLRLLAGSLAAMAVLSGCAAKHQASESLPSTSAAPSTQALPPLGPKDLPMPAAARTKDAAGAEAFVRYYIALINRTSKVMDAKPLRDFSQNCRDCNRIATDAEHDAAAGYHYTGGTLKMTSSGRPLLKGSTAEMAFMADQDALTVMDNTGKPVKGLIFPRYSSLSSGAAISWDSSHNSWTMNTLTLG